MSNSRKKICFVVSSPGTAKAFLRDHIEALSTDFIVTLVSNMKDSASIDISGVSNYKNVCIERKISLLNDFKALIQLIRFFKKEHFYITHSVTPKAGLITAVASWIAKVPCRIHIFTGQVWANKRGLKRWTLKQADSLILKLDNHFLTDSHGQKDFLIQEQMLLPDKIAVLGPGSICGVNPRRFVPSETIRNTNRKSLGIKEYEIVFVFMGRLVKDKGVNELICAYNQLATVYDDTKLLLIGENEGNYSLKMFDEVGVIYTGHTDNPQDLLQAGDIFCLPSFREGFGNSVIEASALGLPVICSDIYGLKDAMVDNVTGIRCKPGNVNSLLCSMRLLYENVSLRKKLGENGRKRALDTFPTEKVTASWVKYYRSL